MDLITLIPPANSFTFRIDAVRCGHPARKRLPSRNSFEHNLAKSQFVSNVCPWSITKSFPVPSENFSTKRFAFFRSVLQSQRSKAAMPARESPLRSRVKLVASGLSPFSIRLEQNHVSGEGRLPRNETSRKGGIGNLSLSAIRAARNLLKQT